MERALVLALALALGEVGALVLASVLGVEALELVWLLASASGVRALVPVLVLLRKAVAFSSDANRFVV